MDTEFLSDNQKKALWTLGTLRQLRIWGLITSGFPEITDRGLTVWDQIDKDIKMSNEDIIGVLSMLCSRTFYVDSVEVVLILNFRDDRKRMLKIIQKAP